MTSPPVPNPGAAPLPDIAPGTLFGAYRIIRMLGKGGMGSVYEAQHIADGRIVALKLLSVDLDKMDARQRFLREGRTAAIINHPNAVYIYGTEEIEGAPAITMELVPGGTLEDKVKARGPLPVAESINDILQVIDGLDAALAAGVLHRDVKPSNCFVGANGVVKIGDFGLSKPVDSDEQNKLTKTGLFLGTPVYSSPEQLLGESLDARSDIYAVGVTWYTMLTGELPYQSGSMMQVVAAVLNGAPTPLAKYRSDIPENVAAVVLKSMARKAEDRYQSYGEFREAVAALRPKETTPASAWDRIRAWIVDAISLSVLLWLFMTLGLKILGVTKHSENSTQKWASFIVSCLLVFTVQAIPEGLRGATLGKWMLGIRVQKRDGARPGYLRAAARVGVFTFTELITLIVQSTLSTANEKTSVAIVLDILFRALLLVTVRRGNGFALLHDWLTGTRVVRPVGAITQRANEAHRTEVPALTGSEDRIGPYVVLGAGSAGSRVMKGWDATMQRYVWIVPKSEGTAELPPERRNLARLTRMRWVAGRRSHNENWDAFEAPIGETLANRLTRTVSWDVQQQWILDLTTEYQAAADDGTSSDIPELDEVWITPTNRVVLPERATLASASEQITSDKSGAIIARFIQHIQKHNQGQQLPRHASSAITASGRSTSVAEIAQIVKATLGRPTTISQLRRFALMATVLVPLAACPLVGGIGIDQQRNRDPLGWKMNSIAEFIADSVKDKPAAAADTVTGKAKDTEVTGFPGIDAKFGRITKLLGVPSLFPSEYQPPREARRKEERLAEVFLAKALIDHTNFDTTKSVWPKSKKDREVAARVSERNATIDSVELRAARRLVDSSWKGNVPGTSSSLLPRVITIVTAAATAGFFAALSLFFALTFRRGPLLRAFQLDVLNKRGEPASRVRMAFRVFIAWLPLFLVIAFVPAVNGIRDSIATALAIFVCVIVPVVWLAGMVAAIRTPERGPLDKVVGTWLVPE